MAKSLVEAFLGRSWVDELGTREWLLMGLCAKDSSSRSDFGGSMLAFIEGLEFVVAREDLDVFSLPGTVATEELEPREGGSASGKAAVEGDCSLEDGTDTITGEEIDVPPGLCGTGPDRAAALIVPAAVAPSPASAACSLLPPPTEALKRLYKPLSPPETSSTPLGSSATGAGGAVRSSKVVSVSGRLFAACIWWSAPDSEPLGASAMAAGVGVVFMSVCGQRWARRCNRRALAGGW